MRTTKLVEDIKTERLKKTPSRNDFIFSPALGAIRSRIPAQKKLNADKGATGGHKDMPVTKAFCWKIHPMNIVNAANINRIADTRRNKIKEYREVSTLGSSVIIFLFSVVAKLDSPILLCINY